MHIQIASVSGHSVRFIFKTCQIIADTSMIRQFHEFFNLIFGRFLTFGTAVRRGPDCSGVHGKASKARACCLEGDSVC